CVPERTIALDPVPSVMPGAVANFAPTICLLATNVGLTTPAACQYTGLPATGAPEQFTMALPLTWNQPHWLTVIAVTATPSTSPLFAVPAHAAAALTIAPFVSD